MALAPMSPRSRSRRTQTNTERFASRLSACWPLHPVVTCLLGPISRRRFGQNQRSLFGFLNSAELFGFQDFLKHAEDERLYTPDLLWDYLRANLEPSILASPDGHRWALAAEALERCESQDGNEINIRLLKTIAIVDLFKERSGIIANFDDILKTCFHEISEPGTPGCPGEAEQAGHSPSSKSTLMTHAIFAGSDFDIDQATRSALEHIDEINFKELKSQAGIQPILAKRHYHETGTLRWFEVNIIPVNALIDAVKRLPSRKGGYRPVYSCCTH